MANLHRSGARFAILEHTIDSDIHHLLAYLREFAFTRPVAIKFDRMPVTYARLIVDNYFISFLSLSLSLSLLFRSNSSLERFVEIDLGDISLD